MDKDLMAIASAVAKFALPGALAVEGFFDLPKVGRKLGLQQVMGQPAGGFLFRIAIEPLGATSPQDDIRIHVAHKNGSQIQQAGLLAHFFLGELAIGDVAEDDGEEFFAMNFGLGDGGFDGKFFAGGTHAINGAYATHAAAGDLGLAKNMDVLGMFGTEASGKELFEGGAENIGSTAFEHGFGGGVEHGDELACVDGNDSVHGGANDGAQTRFLLLDGLLDATGFGDVAGNFGSADNGTAGITQRGNSDRDENLLAVLAKAVGFEMNDRFAFGDTTENVSFLGPTIRWQQHIHVTADGFGDGIAEDAFGAGIPAGDDAVEGLANDGVVGGFDDGGQAEIGAMGALVGVGEIAACSVEAFDRSAEGTGRQENQDRKYGDVRGCENRQTKAGAVESVALK